MHLQIKGLGQLPEIVIENVTKDFDDIRALNNIILSIKPNRIYGLLGPYGAGKSTLLNLITTRLRPTKGEIRIDGKNVWENSKALGQIYYMSEQDLFPPNLEVGKLIKWTRYFYPNFDFTYAEELASKFNIELNSRFVEFTKPEQTICKAILALASQAPIIMLDEPSSILDSDHQELLHQEIVSNFTKNPKTMLISTHLIEEVADFLEEVIIVNYGELVINKSVDYLLKNSYTVSGEHNRVSDYLSGKKYLFQETMGGVRSVTVLGEERDKILGEKLGLNFSSAQLVKLFMGLTEEVDSWVEF